MDYPIKFDQKGATAIIIAITLAVLIGFVSLSIDVGSIYATRSELQNVADAAALAGARELGTIYAAMTYEQQASYVCADSSAILTAVKDVALKNMAAKKHIVINDSDILIGQWDANTKTLTVTASQPDAVKVTSRRDSNANSPLSTVFARILSIFGGSHDSVNIIATATAALTGPAIADEGVLKTPFGISENMFPNDCTNEIQFSPTTDSCAAWHNFFDPVNASSMEDKLLGLIKGDTAESGCSVTPCGQNWLDTYFEMNKIPDPEVIPEVAADDTFSFQGGTVSSLFLGGRIVWTGDLMDSTDGTIDGDPKHPAPFTALFDYFRFRDDDGDDSIWTATVPVYKDGDTCENPNQEIPIVGFAQIKVLMPNPPPDSTVSVWIDCQLRVIEGRGGGNTFGNLKGSIPNLVQ